MKVVFGPSPIPTAERPAWRERAERKARGRRRQWEGAALFVAAQVGIYLNESEWGAILLLILLGASLVIFLKGLVDADL